MINLSRTEAIAIYNLENTHCKYGRKKVYVMLGNHNINWFWDEWEVKEYDRLINKGCTAKEIAECLERTVDEVMLMAMDRHMSGKLVDND